MAGFHGAADNGGIYSNMHDLNPALPTDYDLALQHQRQHGQQTGYDFQADLDMFTNTQFFDFDMGEVPETQSPTSEETPQWNIAASSSNAAHGSIDFLNGGNLQHIHNYFPNGDAQLSRRTSAFRPTPTLPSTQVFSASTSDTPTSPNSTNQAGEKRKAEATEDTPSGLNTPSGNPLEDASRVAAEEDKRRRNTAASARFRVKKKQREQALERSAKDMTDRVTYLENRVSTLEMENKLLKDLITEKSGQDINLAELTKRMAASSKNAAAAAAASAATGGNADMKNDALEKSKKEVKIERAEQMQR